MRVCSFEYVVAAQRAVGPEDGDEVGVGVRGVVGEVEDGAEGEVVWGGEAGGEAVVDAAGVDWDE